MFTSETQNQLQEIQDQIETLRMKEQELMSHEIDQGLTEIVDTAKRLNLSIEQIAKAMQQKAPKSDDKRHKPVPAKYRNPSNPTQTWTGRGMSPTWVTAMKENGTFESAVISASESNEE